ncbi:MAG: hypothetical protein KF791_14855 [Verrucomicrobiae bacterium]|nr:hypothetical protein [Verrucomicrobiae bacterium]
MDASPVVSTTPESPAPPPSALILVGVGGAGGAFARRLAHEDPGLLARVVDTDAVSLRRLHGMPSLLMGSAVQRGLGCGGDAVQAANLAAADQGQLRELVAGAGMVLLLAGLGGGVGSGVAPVVARVAREQGVLVVALVALPFEFEGRLRRANAFQGLAGLRSVADLVIPVPHQGVLSRAAASARAEDLMRCADGFVLGLARGLIRMLTGPTLTPLGVADLARVLGGRQMEGGAAEAEAAGPDRVAAVWHQLLEHPFLASRGPIAASGALVLQVAGGPDLTLEELGWLEQTAQRTAPRAQVLVGAVTLPSMEGRLSVLLVVAPEKSPDGALASSDAATSGGGAHRDPESPEFEVPSERPAASGSVSDALAEADARRRPAPASRTRAGARPQQLQQQFDFATRTRGRFEGTEATLRGGENLDEPTYARRGIRGN